MFFRALVLDPDVLSWPSFVALRLAWPDRSHDTNKEVSLTNSVSNISTEAPGVDLSPSSSQRSGGRTSNTGAFEKEFNSLFSQEARTTTVDGKTGGAVTELPGGSARPRVEGRTLSPRSNAERGPLSAPAPAAEGALSLFPDGFVRSVSTKAPEFLRFQSVPDAVKFPNGPYRQAPAEHGGEWWAVNPFTGSEPWLRMAALETSAVKQLPDGFVEVFGTRPTRSAYSDRAEFLQAEQVWEHNLKHFKGTGMPPDMDLAQLETARQVFQEWGLGEPVFQENNHGWRIRFPNSDAPAFGLNPNTAVTSPHLAVALYQVRLLQSGINPEVRHPWIPAHLTAGGTEAV